MAQHDLDDGEFWLPSEFLTDEDLLTDFKSDHLMKTKSWLGSNSFSLNSGLSSPGESSVTETESDEDDIIAAVTRKLANSGFYSDYTAKGLKLSGSPQSTLCGCKAGSSRGSPNSASRASSPPVSKDLGWDFLYAAAGEVARTRMIEQTSPFQTKPNYLSQAQTQARITYLQLQAAQLQRMKEQQMMKSNVWNQTKMENQFQYRKPVTVASSQAPAIPVWPSLQQCQQNHHHHHQPGMRGVFHGENGAKKERTGTGVFLPRRIGTNPPSTHKKSVLLPDRVGSQSGISLNQRSYMQQAVRNQEFSLPNEWTY